MPNELPRDVISLDQFLKAKDDHRGFNTVAGLVEVTLEETISVGRIAATERINRYRYILRSLLVNLIAAIQAPGCRGIHLSLRNGSYLNSNIYANSNYSITQLKHVKDDLKAAGLIEVIPPPTYMPGGLTPRTILKPTPRLLRLFEQHSLQTDRTLFTREANELFLVLKNEDKKPISFVHDAQTTPMQADLRRINTYLESVRMDICLTDTEEAELIRSIQERSPDPVQEAEANDAEECRDIPINFRANRLYRIFNLGQFNKGGRFYRTWWQAVPSKFRRYITINGNPTVEIDYKSLNVSLAYAHVRLEKPEGEGYLPAGLPAKYRKLFKFLLVRALGADEADRNRHADIRKVRKMGGYPLGMGYRDCMDKIREMHPRLVPLLFTGTARELQFLDSRVAEKIILNLNQRGIAVLPIHDSFIVELQYKEVLKDAMIAYYREIVGFPAPFKDIDYEEGVSRNGLLSSHPEQFNKYLSRTVANTSSS